MPSVSFLPFLQTVPWGTRILTALLVVATATYHVLATFYKQRHAADDLVQSAPLEWLVLWPKTSWKFPWTLVVSGFVELSLVEFLLSMATIPFACRYLERLWGFRELLRFAAVVIIASNAIAFAFAWFCHLVLRSDIAISRSPYHGLSGLQSGVLVAFTQIVPENQIQLFGVLKARVKTIPGIYLLLSNVLVIILGPSPFILVQFGFFVSWVYLRFFKLSENGEYRGDRSETFAFQYWFPPIARPYVAMLSNAVFRLAVRTGIVPGWEDSQSNQYALLPGPGGARAEAERRRTAALRALDARLASSPLSASDSPPVNSSTEAISPVHAASTVSDEVVPEA